MVNAGAAIVRIESRDNPLLKELRLLSSQNTAYRKHGRYWIEGDHLCRAAHARGVAAAIVVVAESFQSQLPSEWSGAAGRTVLVSDALFDGISGLESSARVGWVVDMPDARSPRAGAASVVLDRVQDAGNVGSILRSAAAFGFDQILSLKGSAALWSPKVLRAGMGAHFALDLMEGLEIDDVMALDVPLIATSSHVGALLQQTDLPWPCSWIFGHEGQGADPRLLARAALSVRIAQPGGEESLNVAAAAGICLHASAICPAFVARAG